MAHGSFGNPLGHVVTAGERDFAVGDRVIGRNDRQLGVANAQRGTITGLEHEHGGVTVSVGDGRSVAVPGAYLAAGHLDWGYASTVHKNQGATCDRTYLLASDRIYRELGYVALSRGRIDNRIWTTTRPTPNPRSTKHTAPPPTPSPTHSLIYATV